MQISLLVPGTAAYCHKYVVDDEQLLTEASSWNDRNKSYMQKLIEVVQAEGGLSNTYKDNLNRTAYAQVKQSVENAENKKIFCHQFAQAIGSGSLDLDKDERTKTLKRVLDYKTK